MVFCLIGKTCVDITFFVEKYPPEDIKLERCSRQTWERGGNASNNATVLSSLGARCEYFGPMANDDMMRMLSTDMKSCEISYENCPIIDTAQTPLSVVINSEETGSRTIIHNNGSLPNLRLEDFKTRIDLNKFSWINIDGRNELVAVEIIKLVQKFNEENQKHPDLLPSSKTSQLELVPSYKLKRIPVSIELEKPIESLSVLIPFADIVFIGKDFAWVKGARNFVEAVEIVSKEAKPGSVVICAWGDKGAAFATVEENKPLIVGTVPAFPCTKIVDSLGAGDTFFAGAMFGLSSGLDIESSVRFACRLAGAKLSHYGFKNIGTLAKDMPEYQLIKQNKKLVDQ